MSACIFLWKCLTGTGMRRTFNKWYVSRKLRSLTTLENHFTKMQSLIDFEI